VSFVLAVIVAAGVASACSGTTAVVPANATFDPPAADGGAGWYRTGPVMTLSGAETAGSNLGLQWSTDGGKNWQNYTGPVTLPETPGTEVTYRTTDIWGLPTGADTVYYQADRTPPVVSYTGNTGFYWDTDYIFIDCVASDALSGLAPARRVCSPIQGQGWTYGYGPHTYSASAEDKAGNAGQASVTFQVGPHIIWDPVIIPPEIQIPLIQDRLIQP
jgi:hypothetical protein